MNRRRISWLVSGLLAAVGSMAAHALGLLPHAVEGPGHTEAAGPEPTAHLPLAAGLITAIVLVGLVSRAWHGIRGRPTQPLSPAWFVAVPPLGWALQEATERRLGVESFPFDAAREPAFLKGLLVQLLFGILAFLAARLLLAVVAQLRRLSQTGGWPDTDHAGTGLTACRAPAVRPRQLVLALADYERGPPGRP